MTYDVELADVSTFGNGRRVGSFTLDVAPPREGDAIEVDGVGYYVRSVSWVIDAGKLTRVILSV